MKTISKALKEKNKIKNEIAQLQKKLSTHNSVLKGNKRPVELENVESDLFEKTSKLVLLKTAITKANQPIQEKIYRLAELRGLISFYKKLSTIEGLNIEGYRDEAHEYEAFFNEAAVDEKIKKIETEAEVLQDELETFNFVTTL